MKNFFAHLFRPFAAASALRVGDGFRVDEDLPRHRLDQEAVDYLALHYDQLTPGLGRVVSIASDQVVFSLWGRLYRTPLSPDDPRVRPLSRWARFWAPEQIGEALLRRQIARAQVTVRPWPRARQRCVRAWLRQTHGPLPILAALGGRIHPPIRRQAAARVRHWLGERGWAPSACGYVGHGLLVDRIGATLTFTYHGEARRFWLDHILLHKNGSIHLVGLSLDLDEPRTFRLDKLRDLTIDTPSLGPVAASDLHHQLAALWSGWDLWRHAQVMRGGAPPPPLPWIWRAFDRLSAATLWLRQAPGRLAKAYQARRQRLAAAYHGAFGPLRRLRAELRWRAREFSARRRLGRTPSALAQPRSDTWRKRLSRAAATLAAGGREQITCLRALTPLLADARLGRAYLRHIVSISLKEAEADPRAGHPAAPRLLAAALDLSEPNAPILTAAQRARAQALLKEIVAAQPGWRRAGLRAMRRYGANARLLLCEHYLAATFALHAAADPLADLSVDAPLSLYDAHRAGAYFIAEWRSGRFHLNQRSAQRIGSIIAWWDRAQIIRLRQPPHRSRKDST